MSLFFLPLRRITQSEKEKHATFLLVAFYYLSPNLFIYNSIEKHPEKINLRTSITFRKEDILVAHMSKLNICLLLAILYLTLAHVINNQATEGNGSQEKRESCPPPSFIFFPRSLQPLHNAKINTQLCKFKWKLETEKKSSSSSSPSTFKVNFLSILLPFFSCARTSFSCFCWINAISYSQGTANLLSLKKKTKAKHNDSQKNTYKWNTQHSFPFLLPLFFPSDRSCNESETTACFFPSATQYQVKPTSTKEILTVSWLPVKAKWKESEWEERKSERMALLIEWV